MTVKGRTILGAALVACLMLSGLAAWAAIDVTWQGQKQLLPFFVETDYPSVCSFGNKIYVFGGLYEDSSGDTVVTKKVQIYDATTDSWSAGTDMPSFRYLSTAVEVGGKIYVMAGRNKVGASYENTDVNQVYDPATNTWANKKNCPLAYRGHAGVAHNGKIYLFGGNADSFQNAVHIYDVATDSWSTGATMPKAMAYGSAAVVGDKIYYFAAILASPAEAPEDFEGKLYIYDPVANSWDSTAYPMLQIMNSYGQSAAVGTKIYLFGGPAWYDDGGFEVPTEVCQAFDTTTKAWSQIEFMPSPIQRGSVKTGVAGGKVYLIGGNRNFYALTAADRFRFVDVYDPSTDSYYQGNAPVINYGQAIAGPAGVINGKIYAAHGAGSGVDGKVDSYDIAGNSWTTSTAASSKPQYYSAGGVHEGKLIVSGGVDSAQALIGNTAAYDPATDTWSALAPDPTARYSAAGCVLDGKLYVFGGDKSWSSPATVTDAHVLDIASNTWSTKKVLPSAMEGMVALPYQGKIYIVGGAKNPALNKAGDWNTQTLVYDPATDSYDTSKAAMPSPVVYAAGDVYGDYLFIHGGYFWYSNAYVTYFPNIQVYDIKANTWSTIEGLFGRINHNVVASEGKLYVFNGYDSIPGISMERLCIGSLSGVGPVPLSGSASANPTSGAAPLNVQFSGSATGGTPPYTYGWAFGDGGTSADQNPAHTYAAEGSYSATLTVTDSASATATATVSITVGGTTPLTATASAAPMAGPSPLEVDFTVTASGGTPPYTYAWDFGDGASSMDQNPSHTYEAGGIYTATVTVTDSESATVNKTLLITVVSVTPPAVTSMSKAGNPFRFIVNGSNFKTGIQVFIGSDTTPWATVSYKSTAKLVIKGGSALKAKVPKGTPTVFTFKNTDGGVATYTFTW